MSVRGTFNDTGDNGEGDPPVLIPNTEVKPFSAGSTWLDTAREIKTLPVTKKKNHKSWFFFFCTVNSESVRQAAENGTDFVRARDCKQSSVLMYTIERQYSQTGRKVCRYTRLLPGDKGGMPVTIKKEARKRISHRDF